jgi:arsenate reductase (glutaredoxin)
MKRRLLHNPRCSKSRQAKAMLEEAGVEFQTIDYLQKPLSRYELKEVAEMLGLEDPRAMLRKNESAYKELNLDNLELTAKQIFLAVEENPILLERPIFIAGDRAVIGRPTEDIKKLL